jgi:hypothetical protein
MTHARQAGTHAVEEPARVIPEPHRWALSPGLAPTKAGQALDGEQPRPPPLPPFHVRGRRKPEGLQNPIVTSPTITATSIPPSSSTSCPGTSTDARRSPRRRQDVPRALEGHVQLAALQLFPITRGGGRKALAYSQWLIDRGWSLLIFPEGQRSRPATCCRSTSARPSSPSLRTRPCPYPHHRRAESFQRDAQGLAGAGYGRVGPLLRFPPGTSVTPASNRWRKRSGPARTA